MRVLYAVYNARVTILGGGGGGGGGESPFSGGGGGEGGGDHTIVFSCSSYINLLWNLSFYGVFILSPLLSSFLSMV